MKKYLVLAAAVVMQSALGGIYAWSAFVPPLRERYGLTTGQTQLVFGVALALFILAMVFAGRWQTTRGPRLVATVGGILFGGGYLLASFSGGRLWGLVLGIGVVSGAGIGFAYVCPIATCIRWFPARKGLVTGVAVAGFGGGAVLLSSVAAALFARGWDPLAVFRLVGLTYGPAIVLAALAMFVPGACPRPAGAAAPPKGITVRALVRDRRFWLLFAAMFAGTFAGLMTIGNLKPIGLAAGAAPALATAAISALAVGNAAGRLGWGWLADRLGWRTIPLSLAFLAAAVALLIPLARVGPAFLGVAAAVGFGFGACLVLYAAAAAHYFGADEVGRTYPLISLSYGLSGTVGPVAAGWIFDASATYVPALALAAALAAAGAALVLALGRRVLA